MGYQECEVSMIEEEGGRGYVEAMSIDSRPIAMDCLAA